MEKQDTKSFEIEIIKKQVSEQTELYNSLKSKLPDKGKKLKQRIDELENTLSKLTLDSGDTGEKLHIRDCDKSHEESSPVEFKAATKPPTTGAKSLKKLEQGDVHFNSSNPVSFKDLADENAACFKDVIQSPSFSGWRDPVRQTKLTDAKPLIETNAKKGLNYPLYSKPLLDVNEDSIKKIQHSLVTYPDDTIEENDPENLKTTLMTHQKKALAWLMWREKQDPSGGILADDMGLGKTLIMISLILKQNENGTISSIDSEKYYTKGTLIVCLASVIHQWNDEVNKHCNPDAVGVLVYHGTKRDKNPDHMSKYDIVLTTYNIVMSEKRNATVSSPLFKLKWERIILDEAHTIKNDASQTAQAIFSLRSYRKWAVTGTPIHNVFKDMYSLVKFLQFSPFDDKKKFKKLTDESEASEKRKKLLVKSIVLRRTKEEADEQGNPLIKMEKKSIETCYIELSELEKKVYDKLNEKITRRFEMYVQAENKVKTTHLLVLLLRLQQCCGHVNLLGKDVEDDDISLDVTKAFSSLALDKNDSETSSSDSSLDLTFSEIQSADFSDVKVKSSKIKKLFEKLEVISDASNNQDKCVIVSQWVSMLEIIATHLQEGNIKYYLIAGSTKAKDRQKFIDDFNKNGMVKVMLLSLKAGGVGLNLTGANHLFLMDLHWNPALEMQACDRIHRVGQSKSVTIYKFICKNTIEEKIKALQDEKRSIASSALHGVKPSTKGMTLEDFKTLFYVKT